MVIRDVKIESNVVRNIIEFVLSTFLYPYNTVKIHIRNKIENSSSSLRQYYEEDGFDDVEVTLLPSLKIK